MEPLYASLRSEIQAFEEQVQSCQKTFDLHTLYNLLVLLTENCTIEVDSIEQLVQLSDGKNKPRNNVLKINLKQGKSDIQGYISWFISYMGYLRSLKEVFDNKIVFPLCENLYVNEDTESVESSVFAPTESISSTNSSVSGLDMKMPHSMSSIKETAKELFHHRRKWALLLKGGTISEKSFASESLLDLQAFENITLFSKVLRLVPDIFFKSLATSSLARKWVHLHESRNEAIQLLSKQVQERSQSELGPNQQPTSHCHASKKKPLSLPELQPGQSINGESDDGNGWLDNISELRAKLKEQRDELMFLLWRAERAEALEMQVQETNQRIYSIQQQLEDRRKALDNLRQKFNQEDSDLSLTKVPSSQIQELLGLIEALERHLKLERFQKKILQSDWLLELEVRPSLIRQVDMVRESCGLLEAALKQREEEPVEDQHLTTSETDSETLSLFSEPSRAMSNIFNKD